MRFALLALLGVALAVHDSVDVLLLKPRNEYIFRFEGDVHSGIPLPTDTSISRIQAMVHVQIPDDHHAILMLKDIRFANGHDDRKEISKSIDDLKMHTISKEHLKLLELPVRFVYKNGMISDVMFFNKEETWSANVKRSIINMLQLNLHKLGRTDEDKIGRFEMVNENEYFTVTERTIEGDCEVAYTILRRKDFTTEVTKSVNFDKCTLRPQTKYNFRYLTECHECKESDILEPSTVYTYLLEKDGLKKVEVRSVYTITIENQPVMKTEVRTRLTLEDIKEFRREFEWSDEKKETLIYNNEMEKQIERFYMMGDDVEYLPFEHVKDKVEVIRHIIDDIKELKENKHETTHLLARLVSMFRMLTMKELSMVHSDIYTVVDERLKLLIEHSLSIAGTKNTITHLLTHMEMEHFKVYRVVHLLKSIQETPYPSSKIVDELLRFTDVEVVKRSPVVRQTIWLTIGSVMRGVVGHRMDEILVKEDLRELKEKYLNIMMKEFEKVDTIYEKVLVLKSLANAGIDLAAYELEKIILNKREDLLVRLEAIDALRLLKDIMPRKIQSILMPVYQSRVEHPELRMAALVRIMHTLPRQPLIVQIISTMEREPNQQVAVFTYDLLHSFVKTNHVCYKKLATEILPLLTVTRYQRPERFLTSTFKYFPMFKEELMTGVNIDFATIFGKNSVWPKEMMVSLDTVFSGMWNKYLFQLGVSQQNIEKIVDMLIQKLMKMEKSTHHVVRGHRIRESLTLLRNIAMKLNIRPRVADDRTPYIMLYLRYKDMDYAVLPIDEKIVEDLLEKFISNGKLEKREIERLLNREPEFNLHTVTFLYEITRKIPTTLGLPLIMKCKLPTAISAEGEFTIEMTTSGFNVRLITLPSVASTMVSEMRLWNPLFEQGVKIVRSIEARLPIDFNFEMLYRNGFQIKYTMNVPTEEKTIMHFTQRPITFFRFLSGKKMLFVETELMTIELPQWKRLYNERELMYDIWGMKVLLRGNWLHNWHLRDIILGEYDWELVLIPNRETPKKVRFIMHSENIEKVRLDKIDFTKLFEKEFETETSEYEMIKETDRRHHFHKMVRDIEERYAYKNRLIMKIEALDSNVERYGSAEIVTVCDEELRYCKLTFESKRSPIGDERREWRFVSHLQFLLPNLPKTLMEFKKQIHREVQGLVEMKWGFADENELKMKIQLEQSKEQKKWLKLVDRDYKGITAYDLLLKASRLNQLKVVVDYELSPFMKNLFQHFYNYVKAYTFWHNKFSMLDHENNRIFLKVHVDPMSRSMINVLLKTPRERIELVDYVVPQLYLPSIAKRTLHEIRHEMNNPVCEVKTNKVTTFDDVVFRVPITNCYSVIAKDCSEEPRFVIMMKKIDKESELKKVKIITETEQVIEIMMVDDRLKVMVNDKKIDVDEFEKFKWVASLEDVVVRFDGYTVRVYMGKHMTEKQCGLCGHFDEERDNEFLTANKEYTDDIMEFHESYLLKDRELQCEVDKDHIKEKEHYKVEKYEKVDDEFDFMSYDYTHKEKEHTNKYRKDDGRPKVIADMVGKTKVMEFSHRVCFSLEPLRMCRKDKEMGEVIDKKVRFTCLPRSSHDARQFLHKVRNEVLDLTNYPVSFVETIQVPLTCTVY
ncbi:unnamed protein product [Heligmosomoides polygyrus]|uniref:Vitellogenin domain-containing protein n=1 Tax=Heligmosomoides polygyrus TaxID=6339 RepID=A0A183G4X9_HELPZ|nr:unnamed protein product [Heligmosomoides polygyrus]